MGINFDGVNPESKAKLEKIVADGKVSAEELKGLTATEKEALAKGLGGIVLPDTGEIKLSEPKAEKEEKGFWGKLWDGVKDFASTTTGKVVIGAVGTIAALGITAATLGTGAAVAAGVIGTMLTLQSCSPDDYTDEINQTVMFNLTVNSENSDEEILAELKKLNGTIEKMYSELLRIGCDVNRIIGLLTQMGKSADEIAAAVTNGNQQLTEIKDMLANIINLVQQGNELSAQNNELLTQVLAKIGTIDANSEASIGLLKEILAKLTESVEQNKEMDTKTHTLLKEIIERMDKMDAGTQTALKDIIARIDKMDENVQVLLKEVIERMDKMDADMQAGFMNVINLAKEGNKISEEILNKLAQVLPKLDSMDKTNKNAFTAVLNAINNLGEGTDKKLDAILNAILKGNEVTAAQLEELRKLIAENNEIAQGTQNMVSEMKDSMSEEHKAILDKLGQGNASLDEIKDLLKGIKTGVEEGNVQLYEINDKLNLVGAVLNNILANVDGIKDETKAVLLKILAKIPNGCTCKDVDLSAVLEKLDKILEELKKDPQDAEGDTNHEGILNDLDKYFQ